MLALHAILAGLISSSTAAATISKTAASCSSSSFQTPYVYGAKITSLTATAVNNYESIPGNSVCLVTVILTHPETGDNVTTWVVLPLTNWNGIFQGVGGGGYLSGTPLYLGAISDSGYAAASTDSGHTSANASASAFTADAWALASPGNVNQYTLLNFARRSYHDMTVIGKNVTASFYGIAPRYSYWTGCSTGGRQGLVEAQFYPTDYNGILANAPAIQWNDFTPAQQ